PRASELPPMPVGIAREASFAGRELSPIASRGGKRGGSLLSPSVVRFPHPQTTQQGLQMSTLDPVSGSVVAYAPAAVRGTFVRRAYMHAIGGIIGFAAVEWFIFSSRWAVPIAQTMLSGSSLLVLGAFMIVSWGATHVADTVKSVPLQYLAYAGLVVAEAVIFVPMLVIAQLKAPGVIESAAWVTLMGATGLIVVATVTGKDFSFLRGILMWGGILAIVAIVA